MNETKHKCKTCGKEFEPLYRNGVKVSKLCLSCVTKKAREKVKRQNKRKYEKRSDQSHAKLLETCQRACNAYIRARDNECYGGKSISDNGRISDAGHYFSVGGHPKLRYCVQNIHGQSRSSNYFGHGDLVKYREGLIDRHGIDYVLELEGLEKTKTGKYTRTELIELANFFDFLRKQQKWIFTDKDFQNAFGSRNND